MNNSYNKLFLLNKYIDLSITKISSIKIKLLILCSFPTSPNLNKTINFAKKFMNNDNIDYTTLNLLRNNSDQADIILDISDENDEKLKKFIEQNERIFDIIISEGCPIRLGMSILTPYSINNIYKLLKYNGKFLFLTYGKINNPVHGLSMRPTNDAIIEENFSEYMDKYMKDKFKLEKKYYVKIK